MSGFLKYFLLGLAGLLLIIGGYAFYATQVVNPRVSMELRDQPDGARAARVMLLTMPDGRQIPVNYLREGNLVFAGADGPWWRAFAEGQVPVDVLIQGKTLRGLAHVSEGDRAYIEDVFTRLRPDVPTWLPLWLNAKLVVITLAAGTSGES
jgi:hypothetical protein